MDESSQLLLYSTIASTLLLLLEQWLGHSSCEANSTSGLIINQARQCLRSAADKDKLPMPSSHTTHDEQHFPPEAHATRI